MKDITNIKIEKEISKIKNKYNYTWDNEGKKILLDENKLILSEEEKKILQILLIQDIPSELHKNLWIISSGTRLLLKENKNYYRKLLKFYEKMEKDNHYFYKYLTKKISLDLNRSNLKDEEIYKLKNILNAFSVRNVSLNYCQGLNLIVSYLLQMTNYNEEESFYLFIKLMEDILPFDYFFFAIGIEVELNLVKKLLEKFDNELYTHIMELKAYCFIDSKISMWIISLMLFKIDIRIANLFFDYIFLFCVNNDNYIYILYTMIFSIFAILRNDILKCNESQDIGEVLDNFLNNPISDENFQKIVYYNLISEDKFKFYDKSIYELRQKEIKIISKEKKINFKFEENIEEVPCNKLFPLCVKDKEEKPIEDFVVYKSKNDLNVYVYNEYYGKNENESKIEDKNEKEDLQNKDIKSDNTNNDDENKKNEDIEEDENLYMKNLIIERRKHKCE